MLINQFKNTSHIRIIISDLDGTLLPSQGAISSRNIETLKSLQEINITRVIATGRTLYSALSVLPADFPIDYLIFSSGAGIMEWSSKQIIYSQKLDADEVAQIASILIDHQADFMIQEPIPNNHQFWYYQTGKHNPDFSRRLNLYKQFATPIGSQEDTHHDACQFLVILSNRLDQFEELKEKFSDIKIIRATSPLDHESIWMEIFPEHISKGYGGEWLCRHLGITSSQSMGIGNDYNDIDLLDWCQYSYVVSNAPYDLRSRYQTSPSDLNDGFSEAISKALTANQKR